MMKLNRNKRGSPEIWWIIVGAILALGVAFVLGWINVETFANVVAFALPKNCVAKGGECISTNNCPENEMANFNIKCPNSQTCCMPVEPKTSTPSTECSGKTQGKQCDDKGYKFCDKNLVCVTKCDYCAQNNADALCKTDPIGKKQITAKFDSSYKCACTQAECKSSGKCVYNFCSADTTGASYCCPKP